MSGSIQTGLYMREIHAGIYVLTEHENDNPVSVICTAVGDLDTAEKIAEASHISLWIDSEYRPTPDNWQGSR
jgi:hypothetical protein